MGSGFKNFTAASVLTASDVNNFLMEQSVMSFASTGARDVQITAPEDGMVAYIRSNDADEGLYTYNGTAWRKGPGWNAPWGRITSANSTPNTQTSGTTATIVATGPAFTAISNRYYRVTFTTTFSGTVSPDLFTMTIRNTTTTGTVYQTQTVFTPPGGQTSFCTVAQITGAGASITPVCVLTRISGTGTNGTAAQTTFFLIEDIGPSGAPT